ncbi:MAG: hypothetical protein H6832_14115 [Planctomycetes bacterium]|nr:hypothetical protein [Planctomycetota bacterium]MCB9919533.1 hypothetical protein [Planctomycetota bacterium]
MTRSIILDTTYLAASIYGLALMTNTGCAQAGDAAEQNALPAHLTEAIRSMKTTGRGGLVFVIPDDERREALRRCLTNIANQAPFYEELLDDDESPEVQDPSKVSARYMAWHLRVRELHAVAAIICLSREQAVKHYAVDDDAVMLLIDSHGRKIAHLDLRKDTSKDWVARYSKAIRIAELMKFVRGSNDEHLARIVKASLSERSEDERASLDAALREYIETRGQPMTTLPAAVATSIRTEASHAMSRFVKAAFERDGDEDVARTIERLHELVSRSGQPTTLPYGVTVPVQNTDPCPGCGLARMSSQAIRFLGEVQSKKK